MRAQRPRVRSTYVRIGRTYLARAPSLLLLATVVFLPLGLLDALSTHLNTDTLHIENGAGIVALVAVLLALATTSLIGEVFYSGAVAISLTGPEGEPAPPLREIARRLDYRRLVAIDLVYVAFVALGLLAFVVPGLLAFVWFGLAGPVVEIEKRSVRGALRRSTELVRGNFWTVALVLVPVELLGDAIGSGLGHLVHGLLGHSFVAVWLAEALANIALSPIYAVAAVLLTVDLIALRDGASARRAPVAASTPATA